MIIPLIYWGSNLKNIIKLCSKETYFNLNRKTLNLFILMNAMIENFNLYFNYKFHNVIIQYTIIISYVIIPCINISFIK